MVLFKDNPYYTDREIMLIGTFIDNVLLKKAFSFVKKFDVAYGISKEPTPWRDRTSLKMKKPIPNKIWSKGDFCCAWFHLTGDVPKNIDLDRLYLDFQIGAEGCLYDKSGNPVKGFSNGVYRYTDLWNYLTLKCHYPLKEFVENGKLDLWIDCGENTSYQPGHPNPGVYHHANLVQLDSETADILYDVEVLFDYVKYRNKEAPRWNEIYQGLEEIRALYEYGWDNSYEKAKEITKRLLSKTSSSDYSIYAVGHSHLDLAWLWPFRETKRKAIRTIANAVYLLEKYPYYIFSISQPQQIEWVKEDAPSLFKKLKKYIQEGRIDIVGGGWVESDLNNPGEEALIRQMFYGQKYWLENFGKYTEVGWLPDDFGYCPALPEILKTTNQSYFVTTKMRWCWNSVFPYTSFVWEGLNGDKVLAHFSTDPRGYTAFALPQDARAMETNNEAKEILHEGLMIYGVGDGGGGPNTDVLERLPRMDHTLDLPHLKPSTITGFFKDITPTFDKLPVYKGEMYLENHQGTFTSQSENKQNNRAIEEKLRAVEMYLAGKSIRSFDAEIDDIWRQTLLYQFHDVLPGSSIKRVYEETQKGYIEMNHKLDEIMAKSSTDTYLPSFRKNCYVHNFTQYSFRHYEKLGNRYYSFELLPFGSAKENGTYLGENIENVSNISTKNFEIGFAKEGYFQFIIDKETGKDVLDGYGNRLRVYIDGGDPEYSNWNILDNYRNQPERYMKLESRSMKRYGPLFEIVDRYVFKDSYLIQTMIIDDTSKIIKIHHDMNWKNDNYLVKACFALKDMPNAVHCDTQFGYQDRSTLNDTTHHKAQFELCAYKWIDFSNKEDGFSIFNKTKGGFYAKEGKVELSLLRSANYPCPHMDQHPTSYDYAIYIHHSDFENSNVDELANIFNTKFLYFSKENKLKNTVNLSNENIAISAIKNAYGRDGIVIRAYEKNGRNENCRFSVKGKYKKGELVTALEDPIEEINLDSVSFKPFEIKTIWIH